MRGNLGKFTENLHNIPENLSNRLKIWAKMAPSGAQNAHPGGRYRPLWEPLSYSIPNKILSLT